MISLNLLRFKLAIVYNYLLISNILYKKMVPVCLQFLGNYFCLCSFLSRLDLFTILKLQLLQLIVPLDLFNHISRIHFICSWTLMFGTASFDEFHFRGFSSMIAINFVGDLTIFISVCNCYLQAFQLRAIKSSLIVFNNFQIFPVTSYNNNYFLGKMLQIEPTMDHSLSFLLLHSSLSLFDSSCSTKLHV